jgi:hypothetical protein
MRNTGLDGNGTFGTRSFRSLEDTHPLRRPLDAQMLCAYMMRVFSIDLVEHLARCRNPAAARLAPEIQRFLGVGNGSALGLNLYVNNHPQLLNAWLRAREQAVLAAKCLRVEAGHPLLARLVTLLDKALVFRREDRMEYERFAASADVAASLERVLAAARRLYLTGRVADQGHPDQGRAPGNVPSEHTYPLAALADWLEPRVHPEAFETLLALMTELVPELCDRLAENLRVDEEYWTEPDMTVGRLRSILHAEYAWAFTMDLDSPGSNRFVWYKSETAEEPRRSRRSVQPRTGPATVGARTGAPVRFAAAVDERCALPSRASR